MLFKASVKTYPDVIDYLTKKYSIGRPVIYLFSNGRYPWPNNTAYSSNEKFIVVNTSLSNSFIAGCSYVSYYGLPVLNCSSSITYITVPSGYISVVNTGSFGFGDGIRTYNEVERLKIPDKKINFLIKTK